MTRIDGQSSSITRPLGTGQTAPLPDSSQAAVTQTATTQGDRLNTQASPGNETALSDVVAKAKAAQAAKPPEHKSHKHHGLSAMFGGLLGDLHGAYKDAASAVGGVVSDVEGAAKGAVHFTEHLGQDAKNAATFVLGEIHQWTKVLTTESAPAFDRLDPIRKHEASNYVHHNEDRFKTALDKLDAPTREQVQQLYKQLGDDSLGKESLMKLLFDGKLTQPAQTSPIHEQQSLLESLHQMATEPLGKGLDRQSLLAQTIEQVEQPSRVTQGYKQTCESASTQIMLAESSPGEYVRLLAGLASQDGKVKLANGDEIKRDPHWDAFSLRGVPDDLIQPAFAAYGSGPDGYSNQSDQNNKGESGLTDGQLSHLLSGVFASPFQAYRREHQLKGEEGGVPASLDQRMGELQKQLDAGKHVPVWLDFGAPPGHICLVEGIKDGKVTIDNPYGFVQTMSLKDFENQLHTTYAPAH